LKQADVYRFIATACFQQPGCTAFQTWGFTDKYTWIPEYTKGQKGAPLLFDESYAAKPAYEAVADAFKQSNAPGKTRGRIRQKQAHTGPKSRLHPL
jgi:endo-1,4-beta-xylanase